MLSFHKLENSIGSVVSEIYTNKKQTYPNYRILSLQRERQTEKEREREREREREIGKRERKNKFEFKIVM